ncbi:hypothetical protein SprV_0301109800 [Sparganum proliferum]
MAAWNVRSLLDNPRNNRPEQRTALVARELPRYKGDIADAYSPTASQETKGRQHQDLFDDNDAAISNLLAEKNRLHKAYVNRPTDDNQAAFYLSRRLVQQRLRKTQDAWTARRAEEIQGYADRKEWKDVFATIKAVYGPPTRATAPVVSADVTTLLTGRTPILQRWAEHFRGVLNRPSTISSAAIARLPQVETNAVLDLLRSLHETIRAVQKLSSGKARSLLRSTNTVAPISWSCDSAPPGDLAEMLRNAKQCIGWEI